MATKYIVKLENLIKDCSAKLSKITEEKQKDIEELEDVLKDYL